jgi:hypothetical protein
MTLGTRLTEPRPYGVLARTFMALFGIGFGAIAISAFRKGDYSGAIAVGLLASLALTGAYLGHEPSWFRSLIK